MLEALCFFATNKSDGIHCERPSLRPTPCASVLCQLPRDRPWGALLCASWPTALARAWIWEQNSGGDGRGAQSTAGRARAPVWREVCGRLLLRRMLVICHRGRERSQLCCVRAAMEHVSGWSMPGGAAMHLLHQRGAAARRMCYAA